MAAEEGPRIVATYDYRDEDGRLLYQAVRYEPKDFRQRRPDGQGGWVYRLDGVRRVLYRLPELVASDRDRPVFVVEGEKDADRLASLGCVATTNPMGAGKWRPEYGEFFDARHVVILADNDEAGRTHATAVARALHARAASLKVVALPGLPEKGDVSAWLDLPGNDLVRLLEIVRGCPGARPEPPPDLNGTPRGHAPAAEEWGTPVPLRGLPEPPQFPAGVLPAALEDYAAQCADATNSPPDFVAVPLLALAAGCLGASRSVGITRDHVQPATLFALVVGLPGTGKSPALERVTDPLEEADRRNFDAFKSALEAWKEADPETRGERPSPRRILVDDTTSEALMKTLCANPRGSVMVRDEMSALVAGFNQYKEGKGHDRQVYLKIWSASTIRVDRKSNEGGYPLVIRRPSLSIVGGVQPDVIESFLVPPREGEGRVDDGLLDRFLFSYPRDLPAVEERYQEIDRAARDAWARVVSWLLSLEQWRDERGASRPKIVPLDGSGRDAWSEFTRGHAAELNAEDFPDHLRGPWSKMRGYCGRLALVLHFLHRAEANAPHGPEDVGADAVCRAARLAAYFKGHYLRVATRMGSDRRVGQALHVLRFLARHKQLVCFSRRDLHRQLHRTFLAPESLDSPLALLVQHGYLRAAPQEDRSSPGRKASQKYLINPLWGRRIDTIDEMDAEGEGMNTEEAHSGNSGNSAPV